MRERLLISSGKFMSGSVHVRFILIGIGFSLFTLFLTACVVASEADCVSDEDCASGEYCMSAGGLFARDGVCIDDQLHSPDVGVPTDTEEPGPFDADEPGPPDADPAPDTDTGSPDTGSPDIGSPDIGSPDADECFDDLVECGGICVDIAQNVDHCGGCGNDCSSYPSNASPVCTPEGCDFECNSGFDACDGQCLGDDDYANDSEHCGSCGNSCVDAPPQASPICADGDCDFECDGGFQRCGDECIPQVEPCCDPNASPFGGGNGTVGQPYKLCTVEHLMGISAQHGGDHFRLTADIDASGATPLEPMGDSSQGFGGIFDGDGHTIENISIQSSADEVGLFFALQADAEIFDLTVSTVDIEANSRVGAIAGYAEGSINNVRVDGVVQGDQYVGGAVGEMKGGELIEVSVDVEVTAQNDYVGGLVGRVEETLVVESSARGAVTSQEGEAVGGLIGQFTSEEETMERVFASGDVAGADRVGGLIGHGVGEDSRIVDSYATGSVTSPGGYTGGFVGLFSGTLERCYSAGEIVDEGRGFLGVARDYLEVLASYLDEDTSNGSGSFALEGSFSFLGVELFILENTEFEEESNFDFDFENVWQMGTAPDGHQRPILRWQEN